MFAANAIKSNFIACDVSVKRVVTFGVVLYRNQSPVTFNLHFAELQIDSSELSNTKNFLFGNYSLKCNKAKRNLKSFNCFSEYI